MEREALKLALEALEESKTNNDSMEFHERKNKAIAAIQEALTQPAQKPVNLLEARRIAAEYGTPGSQVDDGNLYFALSKCLEHIDAQPAQEPVAFAGIEIWVGGARITKHLTQTELHYARDPWMLMQYSAELCLAKLKERNS